MLALGGGLATSGRAQLCDGWYVLHKLTRRATTAKLRRGHNRAARRERKSQKHGEKSGFSMTGRGDPPRRCQLWRWRGTRGYVVIVVTAKGRTGFQRSLTRNIPSPKTNAQINEEKLEERQTEINQIENKQTSSRPSTSGPEVEGPSWICYLFSKESKQH
uniref:(northern house mosquito) hypothetical protein n=1 Tax=Culex pipiens TaxID=7175 RepID=A0A8D8KQP4_CULPI